jgi:hypothetical protein
VELNYPMPLMTRKCDLSPFKNDRTMMIWMERQIQAIVNGVMQSMSSARQSEVKAWEEEILACEHTLMLDQSSTVPKSPSGKRSLSDHLGLRT